MTVPATTRKAGPYVGNGIATQFPFAFKVFDRSDVGVFFTDADGFTSQLVLDSDYSVTLNTDQDTNPGGTVAYPISGSPLDAASRLTMLGTLVAQQMTDLTNGSRFLPQVQENAFDYATILIQQLEEAMGRTLRASPGTNLNLQFPAPSSGKFLRWRPDLTGLENADAADTAFGLQGLLADVTDGSLGGSMVGFNPALSYLPGSVGARLLDIAVTSDSAKGAALVGYKPLFTGAIGRTLSARLGDVVSVKDFGAKGDGATNDAAAFQAAIDYCEAQGGGTVFAPRGRYMIGSALTMKRKVGVEGAGIDATILQPTFSGVLFSIDLTYLTPVAGFPDASVYWRKFTIDCVAQTGVSGIKMVQCRFSEISEIKFRGCVENIHIDRGRKHSIHTIYSEGTATLKVGSITLTSTNTSDYVFETHVRDVHFHNNYTTGTQPVLIYIRRGALVLVSDVTLNDGWQGNVTAAVGIILENDCQGCKVSNAVLAAVSDGVRLQVGSGPSIAPSYCNLFNVDIDQARSSAVNMAGAAYCTFVGCKFSSSGVMPTITAVVVSGGAGNNQFIGCHVDNYNGAGGTAFDFTGVTGNRVQDCIISNCTNGVQIGASTTTQAIIGCLFAAVTNRITGLPAQSGNVIKNNSGHRLTTNLSPAMAASAAVTTNNTGYACTVHITGGTVTIISVNGIFTGLTSGTVRLEPGDTIAITYSVAPSWIWIPSWG